MELIVSRSWFDEQEGSLQGEYKFVVISIAGESEEIRGKLLSLFPADKYHVNEAQKLLASRQGKDEDFMGAGLLHLYAETTLQYDSDTCLRKYGRERPEDDEEAEKLLQEIRAKLEEEGLITA